VDKDSFVAGIGTGLVIMTMIVIVVAEILTLQTAQYSYKQMHKGEIACIDTPDNAVYCYKTDKK
jgi:hypothetical protein